MKDAEYISRLNEHRTKADAAATAWSMESFRPYYGGAINAYRRRCMRSFQKHSADYAKVDLGQVPHQLLDLAEKLLVISVMGGIFEPSSWPPSATRLFRGEFT